MTLPPPTPYYQGNGQYHEKSRNATQVHDATYGIPATTLVCDFDDVPVVVGLAVSLTGTLREKY